MWEYVLASINSGNEPGVFIPLTDLPGLSLSEISGNDSIKERKTAYSLAHQIYTKLSILDNLVGIVATKSAPFGAGTDRINQSFGLTYQFMINHELGTVEPLPVKTEYSLFLNQIFPNAVSVTSDSGISGTGILIPASVPTSVGSASYVSGTDCRDWLNALYYRMILDLEPNAALIDADRSRLASFVPPTDFTGASAKTTLTASDLPLRSFLSVAYTLTIQLLLNQATQTFDVAA